MSLHLSKRVDRIYLARHGQSLANLQKQITGQLDVPLSETGKQQSLWLRDVLEHQPLSAIYTSTLLRTIESAQPTAELHDLPIQSCGGFNERYFGELQGKSINDEDHHNVSLYRPELSSSHQNIVSDAEPFQQFEHRVKFCLHEILCESEGNILIVGHRNTNLVILAALLNLNREAHHTINVKNKYVYEINCKTVPLVSTIRLGGQYHGKKFTGLKDD